MTTILLTLFLCLSTPHCQNEICYSGKYQSDVNDYSGQLKLQGTELAESLYQGRFSVTYGGQKYYYPAFFNKKIEDGKTLYSGSITIVQTDYEWTGEVDGKLLKGSYKAVSATGEVGEKGHFEMKLLN